MDDRQCVWRLCPYVVCSVIVLSWCCPKRHVRVSGGTDWRRTVGVEDASLAWCVCGCVFIVLLHEARTCAGKDVDEDVEVLLLCGVCPVGHVDDSVEVLSLGWREVTVLSWCCPTRRARALANDGCAAPLSLASLHTVCCSTSSLYHRIYACNAIVR